MKDEDITKRVSPNLQLLNDWLMNGQAGQPDDPSLPQRQLFDQHAPSDLPEKTAEAAVQSIFQGTAAGRPRAIQDVPSLVYRLHT
jgi:hypothetical protein